MEKILAVLSLVFGMLSLICCCERYFGLTLSVVGLACAIFAIILANAEQIAERAHLRNIAFGGLVTSIVGFSIGLATNLLMWLSFLNAGSVTLAL